jgi:hypothetical protein
MPLYRLSQSELVSLFQSRARIARGAAGRAGTLRESACLQSEAATWDAAASILGHTLITSPEIPDERSLTNPPKPL